MTAVRTKLASLQRDEADINSDLSALHAKALDQSDQQDGGTLLGDLGTNFAALRQLH